jgi:hypothetical protein
MLWKCCAKSEQRDRNIVAEQAINSVTKKVYKNQRMHRKAALTTIHKAFTLRSVDDRKGWFK